MMLEMMVVVIMSFWKRLECGVVMSSGSGRGYDDGDGDDSSGCSEMRAEDNDDDYDDGSDDGGDVYYDNGDDYDDDHDDYGALRKVRGRAWGRVGMRGHFAPTLTFTKLNVHHDYHDDRDDGGDGDDLD